MIECDQYKDLLDELEYYFSDADLVMEATQLLKDQIRKNEILRKLIPREATIVQVWDDYKTGKMHSACSHCLMHVNKQDKFCKHCGAVFSLPVKRQMRKRAQNLTD